MNNNYVFDSNLENTIATLEMKVLHTTSFAMGTPLMLNTDSQGETSLKVSDGTSVFGVSKTNFLAKRDDVLGTTAPFFDTDKARVVKIGMQPLAPLVTGSAHSGYTTYLPYEQGETWAVGSVVKVNSDGKWSLSGTSTVTAQVIKPFDANNKIALIWINI